MTELIYEFLDMYVGGGIKITLRNHLNILYNECKETYVVKSDNGTTILFFNQNRIGGVNLFFSVGLLEVMSNMFSENREQCRKYVRSWFCDRHKINDYRELLSYPIIDKKYERGSI